MSHEKAESTALSNLVSLVSESYRSARQLRAEALEQMLGDSALAREIVAAYSALFRSVELKRKGKFIVVSGIDKSGKETQVLRGGGCVKPLNEYLKEHGYEVLTIIQPSYDTRIGKLVKAYLEMKNASIKDAWVLWSLDRAQHVASVNEWLIRENRIVLAKRWTESNVIYHAAKGIDYREILEFERNVPKQDVTIIIDITAETSVKRNERPDAYESLDFLKKVRELYLKMKEIYPFGDRIYVEGESDPCTVNRTLLAVVEEYLKH
ncbi:MAG: dTMP kinase [Nitrososphaeria archaeon]